MNQINEFKKKLSVILFIFSFALLIIIARLGQLQIAQSSTFSKLSEKNFLRFEKIISPRGNILDCNGRLLATNKPITNLYWQSESKKVSDDDQAIINKISEVLNKNIFNDPEFLHFHRRKKRYLIKANLSFDELCKILELFPNEKRLILEKDFQRFYPYKHLACHVLGYLGYAELDTIGKMGLEKILEEKLKGIPGQALNIINSIGQKMESNELKQALAGDNIITTLDLEAQFLAEQLFPNEFKGVVILMDAENGALKVVVSKPGFDPSIFLNGITENEWSELLSAGCFLNRAFMGSYPPASIFKLVVLSLGLEAKILDTNDTWYCTGKINYLGRTYFCNNHYGHGLVDYNEATAHSCNIPFYEIGKKTKIDAIAAYARKFGLGEKTGAIFNEIPGLIPDSKWKLQVKGEPWWPGEHLSYAIGQTSLTASPMQISCMIGSIITGYKVKPRILMDEAIETKKIEISKNTLKLLKRAMKLAVKRGSAKKLNNLSFIKKIYAKTGTGQTSDLSKRLLGGKYLEHAWLGLCFQLEHGNPLVLTVLIEHAGSNKIAKDYAKSFLVGYNKLIQCKNNVTI